MRQLLSERRLAAEARTTRGGSQQTVYGLPIEERRRLRRETKYQEVAARKSLLQARYHGWSQGTGHAPNLIGQAGEQIARLSLRAAAADGIGYRHIYSPGTEVAALFGQPVPIGALDDATHLLVPDGLNSFQVVTCLIEVKNLRRWIYTSSDELYQLIEKAVRLQQMHPDQLLLPIFICRRAQKLVFWMAKDLGFHVLLTRSQPIAKHSEAPEDKVAEVNKELGYELDQSGEPHPYLVKYFRETLPSYALNAAQQWQRSALVLKDILPTIRLLRDEGLTTKERAEEMKTLKQTVLRVPNIQGNWISADDAELDEPDWEWWE